MPGLVDLSTVLEEPPVFRVLDDSGRPLSEVPELPEPIARRIYRTMCLVRRLDERMMSLQRQGRVGFYGVCTGQEATPVAGAAALADTDWIFPGLREGAAMLYRGYPLEPYICQVFGNAGDPQKGRQMPSHQADVSVRQVSWSSCIGSQIPHAVGAAHAAKALGTGDITVAFFGDGATSTGDFHCAMHFAAVQRVPAVLVCQNNHWSISVPVRAQSRARTLAEKAIAYGMAHARVDGNDPLAVYAAMREAAQLAREGYGPVFLEMVTYRVGPHSSADDPRIYRDEAEVEAWIRRDPLSRFRTYLEAALGFERSEDEAQATAIDIEIGAAIESAEARAKVPASTLFEDVYAEIIA